MKVELWYTGNFSVYNSADEKVYKGFVELQQALDWIEENFIEGSGYWADIYDEETGEVLVHCEDDYHENEYPEDDYDECGYNPYTGCYDWDC